MKVLALALLLLSVQAFSEYDVIELTAAEKAKLQDVHKQSDDAEKRYEAAHKQADAYDEVVKKAHGGNTAESNGYCSGITLSTLRCDGYWVFDKTYSHLIRIPAGYITH